MDKLEKLLKELTEADVCPVMRAKSGRYLISI